MSFQMSGLVSYLNNVLGISINPKPTDQGEALPLYLCERYRLYRTEIIGMNLFLMVDNEIEEQSPGNIGKHLEQIRAIFNSPLVYVRSSLTSTMRSRLIEQRIPFIVPGNQIYLPDLGLDLREHMMRVRKTPTTLSPATQALILHVLLHNELDELSPSDAAYRLGYSRMTLSRAFNELEALDIGEHSAAGKWRCIRFTEKRKALWEKALPFMTTPVKKRIYIASTSTPTNAQVAGLSALGRYTMLADPKLPVYAISDTAQIADLRQNHGTIHEMPEPWSVEIELWKYSPGLLSDAGLVDRLSLYLSLRDHTDERIQKALEALMGEMKW
jgi:hypothetical protein